MAFYEHRLPLEMTRQLSGGKGFRTLVNESDSGLEVRIRKFSRIRAQFNLRSRLMRVRENNPVLRTDIETIEALHVVQEGKTHGFRWQHNNDHLIGDPDDPTNDNQFLADGDDALTQIQVFRRYTYGVINYDRPIHKLEDMEYHVLIDNVELTEGGGAGEYAIDIDTGVITLVTALAMGEELQFAGKFDLPVRFNVDLLDIDHELAALGEVPDIPIIELKLPLPL